MARLDKARLIAQATTLAYRADAVGRDPAVRKAAGEASADLRQAARSSANFVREVASAWDRLAE